MRQLPESLHNEITARAMASATVAREATDYELRIGGVAVRPREIRYRAEDVRSSDAPAMACELTLPGLYTPEDLEDADVEVDMIVRDPEGLTAAEAVWPEFRGKVRDTEEGDADSTPLIAYSTSEWLSRAEIGAEILWAGHTPQQAIRVAVARIPYRRIDVRGIPQNPKLTADTAEPHEADTMRSQLFEDIRNKAQVIFYDTPEGWGTATTLLRLKTPRDPAITYQVGVHLRRGSFNPRPAREGRYASVLVFRRGEAGGREEIRRFPIDNRGVVVPPDVVFPVEVTDVTAQALIDALALGSEMARALQYGAWEVEMAPLIVDSRVVRGTTIAVEDTRDEMQGMRLVRVFRRWLVVVAGYSRDPLSWQPTITGSAMKVAEEEVEVIGTDWAARHGTRGAGIVRPPSGLDWLGRPYAA